MEGVGLAVGLVGLFSTCLEALDKVDSWRNYEYESGSLDAQFRVQKILFQRWGEAVGLGTKDIDGKEKEISSDPDACEIVKKLLQSIKQIESWGDSTSPLPMHEAEKSRVRGRVLLSDSRLNTFFRSTKKKFGWSLRGKDKRKFQVEQLSALVSALANLIPIPEDGGQDSTNTQSIHTNDDTLNSSVERGMKVDARREMQAWLLGGHIPDDIHWKKIDERTDTTCQWILSRSWFLEWLSPEFPEQRTKILWVHGPAGFGKSILCASVVDHLSSTRVAPVAYFFFSGKSQNTSDIFVAVRLWLTQMMSNPTAFDLIEEHKKSHGGFKATNGEILDLLKRVVTDIPGCTLIIDGLDECRVLDDDQGEYDSIETFIKALQNVTKGTQSHIMMVSRGEPQIRNFLAKGAKTHSVIEHRITPRDIHSDIVCYSHEVVYDLLPSHKAEFKESLSRKLAERCEGQFLWIHFQKLACLYDGEGEKALEKAVGKSPKGLDTRYEGDWQRIKLLPHERRDRAISLLRWVVFALRPLTVGEVAEAILIDQHSNEVHVDELPDRIDERYINTSLSSYCGSLLEVQTSNAECESAKRVVQLTHFSVKEFLIQKAFAEFSILQPGLNTGYFTEQSQNTMIAMLCLRYLHCPDSWEDSVIDENALGAFLPYAANFWHRHSALGVQEDSGLITLVNRLFDVESPSWSSWKRLVDETETTVSEDGSKTSRSSASPVFYAARLGLNEVVKHLIQDRKHSVDERGSFGQTPLVAACVRGRLDVTKTLIAHGADVDIPIDNGLTPLHLALSNRHAEVARILVEEGANITGSSDGKQVPIHLASQYGYLEVVKLLLERGVNIHDKNSHGWTALHAAAWGGFEDVCRVLFANGAREDINIGNIDGWTPLHEAAHHGHHMICDLLLSEGASAKSEDRQSRTPMFLASERGHLEVMHFLLEHGADIKIANNEGWAPIHLACRNGHLGAVKILVEKEADTISIPKPDGWTPVHLASRNGHLEILELLLQNGADIMVSNSKGWRPVHMAAEYGHFEIVKLLVQNGADATITGPRGWTPLHLASREGHREIVKLLLQNGADAAVPNSQAWTPVQLASRSGHLDIVKLLLENRADIMATNSGGWAPVHMASENGHLKIVELLLQNGADVMVTSSDAYTSVHLASREGHLEIVKLLLQNGANTTATTSDMSTPVQLASRSGHLDIVKLLLENRADIMVTNSGGWAPVHMASENGHLGVMKLLLQNGADTMVKTSSKWTPVHCASRYNHPEILELLLQVEGVNVHAKDDDGWTPLLLASRNGHLEILKLLLQVEGVDIHGKNNDGWTPAHCASRYGHLEILKLLLQVGGTNFRGKNNGGWTHIHLASRNGHLDIVKLLLQNGAGVSVAAVNNQGWTPVHHASYYGHLEIFKLLLQVEGVNFHGKNKDGWTPIHCASSYGHLEIVKLLLQNGADAAATTPDAWTPVQLASRNGHLEILKLLLQVEGVNVHGKNKDGWTPIHCASRYGYLEIAKLLLQIEGVNAHAKTNHGWTQIHLASRNGHLEIVKLLLQKEEVNIHEKLENGWTPLHTAAMGGFVNICQVLLEKGADIDVGNVDGWTPLHEAAHHGHDKICQLLLDRGANFRSEDSQGRTPMNLALQAERLDVVNLCRGYEPDASRLISACT